MSKEIVGLSEKIEILGPSGTKKKVNAKVDTGATIGSIDLSLAVELQLGPIVRIKKVKQAHGNSNRAIVETEIKFAGETFKSDFTLADRSHMKFPVLLGQNQLTKVLIDPSK
tara:strand:+ start:244 stop:579 length:336 start_codon:yes stop_codon:yes gene_type:complete